MILPIYIVDKDIQDWQRIGNFGNYIFGLNTCPDLSLLPFKSPNVIHNASNSIASFKLQKVEISGDLSIVVNEVSLSTALINIKSGTTYDYYYFTGTTNLTANETGIYQFYFKDSNDIEFYSDLFYIVNNCDLYATEGDFDKTDFNNDFYV